MKNIVIGSNSLQYMSRLERTEADFYDSVVRAVRMTDSDMLASGKFLSLSTAAEEQAIYSQKSAGAEKLSDVDELRDYCANNDGYWPAHCWTSTGLRFREDDLRHYNAGDKITAEVIETDVTPYASQIIDPNFKKENWKDIIRKINKSIGEVVVPYARGHVVREVHPTFGIFTEIEKTSEHKTPYALHGWLKGNLNVPKDPISGHYDMAIGRRGDWHRTDGTWCLRLQAVGRRYVEGSLYGFRPTVRRLS